MEKVSYFRAGLMSLLGQPGLAVFAWQTVAAQDVRTGAVRWSWTPPAGSNITGPAALHNGVITIPVGTQAVGLSAQSCHPLPAPPPSTFRRHLTTHRTTLEAVGVLQAFEAEGRVKER